MANHCTNCGHELREGEKFCSDCGANVDGAAAPVKPSLQYEYCTIIYGEPSGLMGMTGRFRVEASGPYGRRTLTVSDTCKGETYQQGLQQFLGPSSRCQEILNQLIRTLTADGWELLPETDGTWWNHKFRREIQPDTVGKPPMPRGVPAPQTFTEMMQVVVPLEARDRPREALAALDSYLAATPESDGEHQVALFLKVDLLGRLGDSEARSQLLVDMMSLFRRLEEWGSLSRVYDKIGSRDLKKEAERCLHRFKRGLPDTGIKLMEQVKAMSDKEAALILVNSYLRESGSDLDLNLLIGIGIKGSLLRFDLHRKTEGVKVANDGLIKLAHLRSKHPDIATMHERELAGVEKILNGIAGNFH